MVTYTPVKILDQGDVLEFEVKPSVPSVFLMSQKFHRDWEALAETDHGWQAAQTVEVNGVFLGALLPSNSKCIRFEFKPLVRFAWVAHVFWISLLIYVCFASRNKFTRLIMKLVIDIRRLFHLRNS
jgi:hypothetical protein